MTDIVARLRDHENEGVTGSDRFHLRNEAAETITTLRAERDALGVALRFAMSKLDGAILAMEVDYPASASIFSEECEPIRDALAALPVPQPQPIVGWAVHSASIETAALYNLNQRVEAFDAAKRWGANITALYPALDLGEPSASSQQESQMQKDDVSNAEPNGGVQIDTAQSGARAVTWQPMSTAPNDHRTRILAFNEYQVCIVQRLDGDWYTAHFGFPFNALGWMPLPAKPTSSPSSANAATVQPDAAARTK